ncbi:beta-adaptin-like protein C [Tanacetum coccineum]
MVVLNNATVETNNPDLRDCTYIYWCLISTDPEAAKDVALVENAVISDDSNQLDSSLLDELLANIATISTEGILKHYHHWLLIMVHHHHLFLSNYVAAKHPSSPDAPVPDLLDLMGLDGGDDNVIVSADRPATATG